jgi:biopolymer transport protein ExbB/TolQ
LSNQASPIVLRYRERHGPTAAIVVAVLVALLILFLWLHFILALKIESAGREIQLRTEELRRLERHNQELRRQISISGSQERMFELSKEMGYVLQQPVYVLVDKPLPPIDQSLQPTGQELATALEGSMQASVRRPQGGPVADRPSGE